MCTRIECIKRLTAAASYLRKEFEVESMCLFGSMARGDNRPDSDVDVFVEMPPKIFRIIALQQYLEEILGVSVDVVRKHPNTDAFFLKQVERDGITIFS